MSQSAMARVDQERGLTNDGPPVNARPAARAIAPRAMRLLLVVASALGAVTVASLAFAMSFDALTALARGAGIRAAIAWMWPVVVDGSMIVATAAALVLRTSPERAVRLYPWSQLGVFALVSVIGNGLHATGHGQESAMLPAGIAVAVSGVPPVALLLSTHLLVMMLPRWRWAEEDDAPAEPGPAPVRVAVEESAPPVAERVTTPPARLLENPADDEDSRADDPAPDDEVPSTDPAPAVLEADDGLGALADWIAHRERQGEPVSGQIVAEHLGVSLSTGKRRLKAVRDQQEDQASQSAA